MTTDEKRAALEAAGYVVKFLKGGYYDWWIETPDEWTANEPSEEIAIDKAYAHLQREQELAMWRDMANKIWSVDEETMHANTYNATVSREAMIAVIRYRNTQYNITDDESGET